MECYLILLWNKHMHQQRFHNLSTECRSCKINSFTTAFSFVCVNRYIITIGILLVIGLSDIEICILELSICAVKHMFKTMIRIHHILYLQCLLSPYSAFVNIMSSIIFEHWKFLYSKLFKLRIQIWHCSSGDDMLVIDRYFCGYR